VFRLSISEDFLEFDAGHLLAQFSITETDLRLIKDFGVVMKPHFSEFLNGFYTRLKEEDYFEHFFPDEESIQRVKASQITYWETFFAGEVTEDYIRDRRRIGEAHAHINLSLDIYMAGINIFCDGFARYLASDDAHGLNALKTMPTVTKLLNLDASVVASTYASLMNKIVDEKAKQLEVEAAESERAMEALEKEKKRSDQFNNMVVGRELRMIEMKKEVDELLKRLGEEPRH